MNKATFDDKYLTEIEPICRRLSKAIFGQYDIIVKEGTKYGVDQILYKDDRLYGYLELEYADSGRFKDGRYHSPIQKGVSIPHRKQKFFKMERSCWWMSFSEDFNHYILLKDEFIFKHAKVKFYKPNNNTKGEYFYIIDEDLITYNKIDPFMRDQAILLS